MKLIVILLFCCVNLFVSAQESVSPIIIDSIESQNLKQVRKFCLYLPPQFDSQREYPAIIATDGQLIVEGNYAPVLDSLIRNKLTEPFVLIGAYSDETPACGVTVRNLEYLRPEKKDKVAQTYFNNHYRFFTKELVGKVLAKYRIKIHTPFVFYGCSNGGDFGLILYSQKEPMFTSYICLSPVSTQANDFKYNTQSRLYVAYGDEELVFPFGINLEDLSKKMQKYKGEGVFVQPYEGGHERGKWLFFFCSTLTELL